jgi:hypothetical protein
MKLIALCALALTTLFAQQTNAETRTAVMRVTANIPPVASIHGASVTSMDWYRVSTQGHGGYQLVIVTF